MASPLLPLARLCLLSLLTVGLLACDHSEGDSTEEQPPTETQGSSPSAADDTADDTSEVLTVAQALTLSAGTKAEVAAYVVGASPSTLSKTVFSPPFESSVNVVLADSADAGSGTPVSKLLQVKLTDAAVTSLRSQVNLKDHPELHGKKMLFSGVMGNYYSRLALTGIWQVQLLE